MNHTEFLPYFDSFNSVLSPLGKLGGLSLVLYVKCLSVTGGLLGGCCIPHGNFSIKDFTKLWEIILSIDSFFYYYFFLL